MITINGRPVPNLRGLPRTKTQLEASKRYQEEKKRKKSETNA